MSHHRMLGKTYVLLSNLLIRVPGSGFTDTLDREILPALRELRAAAEEKGWPAVTAAVDLVLQGASQPGAGVEGLLARDFTRLFRGVRPGYGPKPPYESLYRGEMAVMGDIAAEVKRSYREAGLSPERGFGGEPPDHIAFELFFMGHLHLLEAALMDGGKGGEAADIAAQREAFLAGHISQWVPGYCDAIAAEAKETFYRGIASLTREMLLLEQRRE